MSHDPDTCRERLPGPFGPNLFTARLRADIEDFRVEEIDAFAADGDGEHLLVTVEKRGMNTAYAAKRLAAWAGVPESALGHAGLKDRHAVAVQRFSVHLPGRAAPDPSSLSEPGLRILVAHRHRRKLPRGALAGNRFDLHLRDVHGDRDAIEARLAVVAERGMTNYFGEQRFGRDGENVAAALAMFAGRRVRREQRSILLSAARSEIFNDVLAARVERGDWDRGLDGEVWMLDGSRSVFGPEPIETVPEQRIRSLDIHPTGPLWGRGEPRSRGPVQALEVEIAERHPGLCAGLVGAGLVQERRALRVRLGDPRWDWPEPNVLRLRFSLPPGSYATALLACLGWSAPSERPTHLPNPPDGVI